MPEIFNRAFFAKGLMRALIFFAGLARTQQAGDGQQEQGS